MAHMLPHRTCAPERSGLRSLDLALCRPGLDHALAAAGLLDGPDHHVRVVAFSELKDLCAAFEFLQVHGFIGESRHRLSIGGDTAQDGKAG
ncbi:hypothetical protein [Streptomyces sp. NPDC001970]